VNESEGVAADASVDVVVNFDGDGDVDGDDRP
jgi:hypothetical protein